MPINSPTKPAAPFSEGAIRSLFAAQRAHFREAGTPDYQRRKQSLRRLRAYLGREANIRGLVDALRQDLRKPEVETLSSELGVVMSHLRYVDSGLRRWMEPKPLPASLSQAGIKSYLYLEPKGNALIIAPWNYPFNLTVVPLIYAISAGCTAIVKPSEMSPATTAYIQRMLDEVFDEREVKVVTGDAQTASLLTTLPFDHIFFTGSPAIGKRVMAAAAENLTSVTLELGGKSPAVIDRGGSTSVNRPRTPFGGSSSTPPKPVLPRITSSSTIANSIATSLSCAEPLPAFTGKTRKLPTVTRASLTTATSTGWRRFTTMPSPRGPR